MIGMRKVMVLACSLLLFQEVLGAEKIQIAASVDLPCELAWGADSMIVNYRNFATYTVTVDRAESPVDVQVFESDLFRFVLSVDMLKNRVIATTYDKFSGHTFQLDTSLEALLKVPMKGTQYIPLAIRPPLRVRTIDLGLDDLDSIAGRHYLEIMADLGLASKDLPEEFEVTRQGIAILVTAELVFGDPGPVL